MNDVPLFVYLAYENSCCYEVSQKDYEHYLSALCDWLLTAVQTCNEVGGERTEGASKIPSPVKSPEPRERCEIRYNSIM